MPRVVAEALEAVRESKQRPDGEELVEATDVAACARQVALGFFYRWKFPRGEPVDLIDEWFGLRKVWAKVLRVEFVKDRNDTALAALAVLKRSVFLGGRAIVPDGVSPIVVSATVGTILQSALVALVLVLAWPAGLLEWLARLAIATVPIAVIVFIDTPLSMASWLWKSQVMSYEPDRFSALVAWNTFLNGGGRLALGLVAGALAIALARALMERIHRARTPRPLG
jgi:hypothetical protein